MKNIINYIIMVSFFIIFLLLWKEMYNDINNIFNERKHYKELLHNLKYEDIKKTSFKIIDYWWLWLNITEKRNNIFIYEEEKNIVKKENKKNIILQIDKINTKWLFITMPKYIAKTKIIVPIDNSSIYEDLKKGVRLSPKARYPNEKGITFLEWHSWNNYNWTMNYSFFDNLAIYYDEIDYKTPIIIENEDFIFSYELFKKEIIEPGSKDFYDSDFHHLILMTCYPRNTIDKRALFHAKLINITKKTTWI